MVLKNEGRCSGPFQEKGHRRALRFNSSALPLRNPTSLEELADVNCSDKIDIADALLVVRYYVGLTKEFPCEASPENTAIPALVQAEFPYSAKSYSHGFASASVDQEKDNLFVKQEWENWKSQFVTASGAGGHLRVLRTDGNNDTASESIA